MTRIMVLWAGLVCLYTVSAATVTFNGSVTNQVIDGFGVNANHRSWNNDELKPVLDALIDQGGMTLFRVVFDQTDWETNNDNADPNVMNWDYYNTVYGSARFTPLWDMMTYLNNKGITDGVFLNLMGYAPSWMAGSGGAGLASGKEGEWAEMVTSLLMYARNTKGVQFKYLAPDNEPDLSAEGIQMGSSQYVLALHHLVTRLLTNGLADVQLIGPDLAGGYPDYLSGMRADPVIFGQLGKYGVHSYNNIGQGSPYPDRNLWVTEFNVWCNTCDSGTRGTYDWAYCKGTADYLLRHLAAGASAGIVWEGYDSLYFHYPSTWSFWGLFSVDNENAAVKTYTARKNFYTVAQISRFVRPGAQQINVSGSVSALSPLLAFKHSGLGQITIAGINTSGSAVTLSGVLASLPTVSHLDLYYTSTTANLANGGSVTVNNGSFNATIPADCVFTLVGSTGVQVAMTGPANGAQYSAPAAIPLAATATSTTGSIALVGFYNGAAELGDVAIAPYVYTWNDVPMGNYALSAVAGDTQGNLGTSAVVNVTVVGPLVQIGVTPANVTVTSGGKQLFSATGFDLVGHALAPQPTFVWSVDGGGTIDSTGQFTAGSLAGGPFSVVAASGGFIGAASVSVAATGGGGGEDVGGGTIGNTKEGTATDGLWDTKSWINASRFLAGSNMIVSAIHAKVGAMSGGYKCAVYTDKSASPNALLGSTAEVRSPTNGWNVFPLTTSVTLTNGQYYWLAIWSDNSGGKVYYSDSGGTLRWGQYNYGTWPNPISTSGGGGMNYCIYARGSAPATLASVTVTPANPTDLLGATRLFTATANYSDGSTQNVTSQATWSSSDISIATIVSASGLATAVAAGSTTISATFGAKTGTTTLTVQAPPTLKSVVVTPAGAIILAGATRQYTVTGTYSDDSTQNVTSQATWSSSDTGIATINVSGLATAVAAGSTTISATFGTKTGSTTLTVLAPPTLKSVIVAPADATILAGATRQYTVTGTYSDDSTQNVTSQATWSSSDTGVAAISTSGLATAVAAGSTTISASFSGMTGATTLIVQAPPLAIVTTSLATGTVNLPYMAVVSASGGTGSYGWLATGGSLPDGLTLDANNGSITGTPTSPGIFNFTVQVTDAGQPRQTASQALSLTILSVPANMTIWPGTAMPVKVDGGSTRAAELGVKFRSDMAGKVSGIRFYKASANTGTHVGNLWTSAGSRLATATFTGETASGWQQVNFATPVAISANTTYVASYHVNSGHFSADAGAFVSVGVDNPPLHVLTSTGAGGNGVYRSSSSSAFPNVNGNGTNYWVDLVFKPTVPPTLVSIAVNPANATVSVGATQQFTATGNCSDGSTQDISGQVIWASSTVAVGTVTANGLATAVSIGSTTISATLGAVSGSAFLTAQAPPLTVTTTSLSSGVLRRAYQASLTASGGTKPYTWSIASGSLPPGLSLNAGTGALTGSPTVSGTFSFSARVRDSGTPIQSATKAFTVTIRRN